MNIRSAVSCTVAALSLALLSACSTPHIGGGSYNPPAHRPQNPDNVRVKVSLRTQQVYVMEGDRALLAAATCVGTPEKPTPTGSFRAYNKIEKKRSGSYGFWVRGNEVVSGTAGKRPPGSGWNYVGYPMPYWVEFAPAYGFHLGYVHPMPRTHGCLRLSKEVAPKFFALVKTGTPINVAHTQPEDQTIGKNLPRPSDFRDPDPDPHFMVSPKVFAPPAGPLFVD